jgi:hypothetical protein
MRLALAGLSSFLLKGYRVEWGAIAYMDPYLLLDQHRISLFELSNNPTIIISRSATVSSVQALPSSEGREAFHS